MQIPVPRKGNNDYTVYVHYWQKDTKDLDIGLGLGKDPTAVNSYGEGTVFLQGSERFLIEGHPGARGKLVEIE